MNDCVWRYIDMCKEECKCHNTCNRYISANSQKGYKILNLEKALEKACRYLEMHTGYCPEITEKYVTDCNTCNKKEEAWICWKERILGEVNHESDEN